MKSNVIFKLCDLKILIADEDSCVEVCKQCCRKLKILPSQTRNLKQSVKESLDSAIGSYDSELNGIILNSKNIKVQPFTKLVDDGYLAVTYKGDIYIFNPKIGSILKGIINKKSDDHIGVLVHTVFNVVIPCPANKSFSSWRGSQLNIGDNVIFKVNELNLSSPLPYIRGNFIDSDSNTESDLTDSGIDGNDQNVDDPNPNEISKLIHPDYSSNEDEAPSLTQVIPTENVIQSERLCCDKQYECDKDVCSFLSGSGKIIHGGSNITYRKQKLKTTEFLEGKMGKLVKKSLANKSSENKITEAESLLQKYDVQGLNKSLVKESDEKKNVFNNKEDKQSRLKETISPTKEKDNFLDKVKKFEKDIKSSKLSLKTNANVKAKSNPQKQLADNSSYSSEDDINRHSKLLEIKPSEKRNTSARNYSPGNSSSSEDENIQDSKSLKIKSPVKRNTTAKKSSAGNSIYLKDDNNQHSNFLDIKSQMKHNTSVQKLSPGNSSSSEDENDQQAKMLEIKSPVKYITSAQKSSPGNSSSSKDENIQDSKLLNIKSPVKPNTSVKKPSERNSSSSEHNNEHGQSLEIKSRKKHKISPQKITEGNLISLKGYAKHHSKLLDIKSQLKHNTSVQKPSAGNSSSSKGENVQQDKVLEITTSVKRNTSARKSSPGNSSSSEDENVQQHKMLEIKTPVKRYNSARKSSSGNSSYSEDENVQQDKMLEIKTIVKRKTSAQKSSPANSSSSEDENIQQDKMLEIKIPVKHNNSARKSSPGNSSSSEDENVQQDKILEIKTLVKPNTSARKSSSENDNRHGQSLEVKSPKKYKISAQKITAGNSNSLKVDNNQHNKLLDIKSQEKHNTGVQKLSAKNSSFSEDENIQQDKMLEIKIPVKHNNSARKSSGNSSSSEDDNEHGQSQEIKSPKKPKISAKKITAGNSISLKVDNNQHNKLLDIKSQEKHNTGVRKPCAGNSSSSEDENDQQAKMLKIKSPVKYITSTQKSSPGNSSSSEDEIVQGSKLLNIKSIVKHNTSAKKPSARNSSSSEDDNEHGKSLEIKSREKHKISAQQITAGNLISLKDDNNQHSKLVDIKSQVKHNTSVQKPSAGNSSSIEDENKVKKVRLKKDSGRKHKEPKKYKMELAYVSKPLSIQKEGEKLLSGISMEKANKKHVFGVETKSLTDQPDVIYEDKLPKIKPKKDKKSIKELAYVSEPSSNEKEGEKHLSGISMEKVNKKNVLGVETKSDTDQPDLRYEDKPPKIKPKKDKKSKKELAYASEPSSIQKEGEKHWSGISMEKVNQKNVLGVEAKSDTDQPDLRYEDKPPKIKAKKDKTSKKELAYVSEPSSIQKEGEKHWSGISIEKVNTKNVLCVDTKSDTDQPDLRYEDKLPKIKPKKDKKSKIELAYVSEPSSIQKEGEKHLSGISMEKVNKQNVLGVETKSDTDQPDLRYEDKPLKIKEKKEKTSKKALSYVSKPSNIHKEGEKHLYDVSTEKVNKKSEKLATVTDHKITFDLLNNESECLTKIQKKNLKNRGTTALVEKNALNKNTEGSSNLMSLLLAKAALEIKAKSAHIKTNKRKHEEKKDKQRKKKPNKLITVTDITFKSSEQDLEKLTKIDLHGKKENNEGLDVSDVNKKSLKKKKKRAISVESEGVIPSINKDPEARKKKKLKKEHTLNEMTSVLLNKALKKLNKTLPKTDETSVTNSKEDLSRTKAIALRTNSEVDIDDDIESIPCYQKPVHKETFYSCKMDHVNTFSTKNQRISMPNTEDRQRKIPPNRKSVSFQNYVSSVFPQNL